MIDLLFGSITNTEIETIYVDNVFSSFIYTGNDQERDINNKINLSGKGGSIWTVNRKGSYDHCVMHSARGWRAALHTNNNYPETIGNWVSSVNNSGYKTGTLLSRDKDPYVSWVFRNADKFYGHKVVNKKPGSHLTVSFGNLHTLGMVRVKRVDIEGSWYVWHRSLPTGKLLIGESDSTAVDSAEIAVSGTTVLLVNNVIANGKYLVEAFAHDDSPEGIIQCGSYKTDANGSASINTGWESQFVMTVNTSINSDWHIHDHIRGMTLGGKDAALFANTTDAEVNTVNYIDVTSSGFNLHARGMNHSGIYLVIRYPNKPSEIIGDVYKPIVRLGNGLPIETDGVGFTPDMLLTTKRGGSDRLMFNRSRGNAFLSTNTIDAEKTIANQFDYDLFSTSMDGVKIGSGWNNPGVSFIDHYFKRTMGVFDSVCDTGTGVKGYPLKHSLKAVPEMVILMNRNTTGDWIVASGFTKTGFKCSYFNRQSAATNYAYGTIFTSAPDENCVYLATNNFNNPNYSFVALMFASYPGVSKVGSYVGDGNNQVIDCGFSAGSRFVLIKRLDGFSDWFLWDSARGILADKDPYIKINSDAPEVITDNSIDPHATGFIVKQTPSTFIDAFNANYFYLAFA